MDMLERVENYWYESAWIKNLNAPAVASEDDVAAFELQEGVQLPADFREYLLRLNGTDGAGDDLLFCFWPIKKLERLVRENLDLPDQSAYFLFADFMIDSWYYAIYLGGNPLLQNRVILPDFPGIPVIAQSFTEFLERYLTDAPCLYGN